MEQDDNKRKVQELENIRLKLKMISKNPKSTNLTVDEYINNIMGSGLKINKPVSTFSQESKSLQCLTEFPNKSKESINSCYNINTQVPSYKDSAIQSDFLNGLPYIYRELIDSVKLPNGCLDTQKIYEIYLSSGLGTDILGTIWSLVNRTLPGKLTIFEFSVGLAMIAICQSTPADGLSAKLKQLSWESVMSTAEFSVPKINYRDLNSYHNNDSKSDFVFPPFVEAQKHNAAVIPNNNSDWADFTEFVSHKIEDNVGDEFQQTNQNHKLKSSVVASTSVNKSHFLNSNQEVSIPEDVTSRSNNFNAATNNDKNYSNEDREFGDFSMFSCNQDSQASMGQMKPNQLHNGGPVSLSDRYKVFDIETKDCDEYLVEQWLRCLVKCHKIITDVVKILSLVENESLKIDIFNAEKGIVLLQGIIEVYRVARNIKLSASYSGLLKTSKAMLDVLSEIERSWNEFMLTIPDDMQIDVQSKLSKGYVEPSDTIHYEILAIGDFCGVCLCKVDADDGFLSHGPYKYHCPCANLWVNTLDLTLPGLVHSKSVF